MLEVPSHLWANFLFKRVPLVSVAGSSVSECISFYIVTDRNFKLIRVNIKRNLEFAAEVEH